MLKINKLLKSKLNIVIYLLFILFYLVLVSPSLFSNKHLLFNLEPYPDALYYTSLAKNFFQHQVLKMELNNYQVKVNQPPLYPIILSLGYFFWNSPASFYLVNSVLMLISFLLLIKTILSIKTSNFLKITSIFFLISHAYLYWIISLAMTENLTFFILSVAIYLLNKEKEISKTNFVFLLLSTIALALTRLSVVPTAIVLVIIALFKLKVSSKIKTFLALLGLALVVIFNTLLKVSTGTSLIEYLKYFILETFFSKSNNSFYSIKFVYKNLVIYLKTLLGYKISFLWFKYPLTSFSLIVISLINLLKTKSKAILPELIILASIFTLLLSFYTTDSRYIIYTIPLLILIMVKSYPNKIGSKYQKVIILFLIIHLYTQLPLFKEIIASNILHKSTAWQYQAILHFNQNLNKNDYIITALPPFLVDAYQTTDYQTLPISHAQEFLQKQQYVWGDIDYANLIDYYKKLVKDGKYVYISNSYITHQQQVIKDYENIKANFKFKLVSQDCLDSCNIYQLELKD